jgi:hypothetical protein
MTSHSDGPVWSIRKKKIAQHEQRQLDALPAASASQSDRFSPFSISERQHPLLPSSLPDPRTHKSGLPKAPSPNSRRSHLSGPVSGVLVELIRRCGPCFCLRRVYRHRRRSSLVCLASGRLAFPTPIKAGFWLFGPYACSTACNR